MKNNALVVIDLKKLPELLAYYESKGCTVTTLHEAMQA